MQRSSRSATFDVRRALRDAALAASYRLGAPRLADVLAGRRVAVLMYHGVPAREHQDGILNWYGYNVPVPRFTEQLEYVARRCHVVALADALAGRNLAPRRTNVVLTFDDGYENNFTHAFPVLQRLRLPATFALATGFVRNGRPLWNDVLEYTADRARPGRGALAWGETAVEYDVGSVGGRVALFHALWQLAMTTEQAQRDTRVAAVAERLGVRADAPAIFAHADYRPLQAAQIKEMAASGLAEFCSHSVHHYALPHLAPAARRAELAQAKADVEALSGRPCPVLCLPGGKYDAATLDDAFASGYGWVLTSDRRDAEPSERVVGRYVVARSHTPHEFTELVHGPIRRVARWLGRGQDAVA